MPAPIPANAYARQPVGTLERVDLRALWESEALHFTPWLAQEHNLARLAEVLGLDLEFEGTEKVVGPFKADILCKVPGADEHIVLIENQLERTDHSHLGQIITYAAGLQAVTVVWIAKQFTEEHRAALDWLNEKLAGRCNFFGLEIELWRIGSSPVAPKFNVISKPNDWASQVIQAARAVSEISDTKLAQQEYWQAFRETLLKRGSVLKPQKALPQHWTNLAVGRANFWMSASQKYGPNGWVAAELHMNPPEAKAYFAQLHAQKEQIEKELGFPLQWEELPDRKESRMVVELPSQDTSNRTLWPQQHAWLADKLERMHATFKERIRAL
jgi:hypothetical protein